MYLIPILFNPFTYDTYGVFPNKTQVTHDMREFLKLCCAFKKNCYLNNFFLCRKAGWIHVSCGLQADGTTSHRNKTKYTKALN